MLLLRAIKTSLDGLKALLILPGVHLVYHGQCIGQYGKDDVEQEERTNDDETDTEEDCHPPNI